MAARRREGDILTFQYFFLFKKKKLETVFAFNDFSLYDLTSIPVMYASYAWPEINRRDRGTSNANWPNGSVAPFENAVEGQSFPPFWILLSLSSAYAQKLTAECSERKFLCTFQFMCEFA